ncbi:MAG: S9 family peptidase [Anaerolineales bacterium]|nr:S9 family peptidase [Anaerolineales bacterium]
MKKSKLELLEPKDLFQLSFIVEAEISLDGKWVLYSVLDADLDNNSERSTIWLLSIDTGDSRRFLNDECHAHSQRWSPDGNEIAYISDRFGEPQIFVYSMDRNDSRQITFIERGVHGGPIWSPEGKTLCFTTFRADQARDPNQPYRITRATYRYDETGLIDDAVQELYLVPSDGGDVKRLTDAVFQKKPIAFSPNGQEILFGAMWFPDSQNTFPHLWITNLDGESRELVGGWGENMCACWTLDGERVVFIAPGPDGPDGAKHELWVIDRDGQNPRSRTSTLDGWVGSRLYLDTPVWPSDKIIASPDGAAAYTNVVIGGTVQIIKASLQGKESWTPLVSGDRACYLQDGNSQHLLFIEGAIDSPNELCISTLDGTDEKRLTHVNKDVLSGKTLARVDHFFFPARDGVPVEGWILYPPYGDPPFPTVLHNHGGPHSSWGFRYNFEFQMLAAAGYAVLAINYRGSVGYGDAFSAPLVGNMGEPPYDDLMDGVDYAIAKGMADPDRLGCCGQSAGAFLTCWIVGHTKRFKAAVAESTYVDYAGMFYNSHAPDLAALEMGGYPYDIPDVYRRCSPITYAHHCQTPVLLVVNDEDHNCPPSQAEAFYTVLKSTGCTVEMLRLPNSSHDGAGSGPLPGREAQNRALLEWMNRFLLA